MTGKQFAAESLIDCHYNISVETSSVYDPERVRLLTAYSHVQFVFCNADHKAATLDGGDMFHCKGGIVWAYQRLHGYYLTNKSQDCKGLYLKLPIVIRLFSIKNFSQSDPFNLKKY